MPVINVQESLRAGILDDLRQTWEQNMPNFEKEFSLMIKALKPSTLRSAPYAFKDSLPFPKYWPYGEERKSQTFKDRLLEIQMRAYELTINWNAFDESDDQLADLRTHINLAVNRFGLLPMVLASEYFNGVAVENPSLGIAYDGANLFATTDGDGANRFGASGGNILSGSGLTVSGVIHDLAQVQQRLLSFKDPTAGKPIFSEDDVSYKRMHVIAPNAANEVLQKASNSEYIRLDPANNTSESNWLKSTFQYHLNPFLTDTSDYYVLVDHPFWKPFAYRPPKDIKSIIADMSNSDRARNVNEYGLYAHVRVGLGVYFPAVIVKVDN